MSAVHVVLHEGVSLLFLRPSSWNPLSWVIQKVTKSRASHAAIGLTVAGVPLVLHASVGGVQFDHRAKYLRTHRVVEEYAVLGSIDVRSAVGALNEDYDYVGLFGFAWAVLSWRWFRKRVKNPLASPRAVVCSELLFRLGLEEFSIFDPETATPESLRKACESKSRFAKVA